jgi:hypothetical protein
MPQLFPDMPLPYVAPNGNGIATPGVPEEPEESTTGEIVGLTQSLIAFLQNYRPGVGLSELGRGARLTLPVPEWAWWWDYKEENTGDIAGGSAASQLVHTVPTDERHWLDGLQADRNSGDNLAAGWRITFPTAYASGTDPTAFIMIATTPASELWWPDQAGLIACNRKVDGPLLLEPGTQIRFNPSGAGSSTTSFSNACFLRKTKFIRALTP